MRLRMDGEEGFVGFSVRRFLGIRKRVFES